jgi:hypothetical protein
VAQIHDRVRGNRKPAHLVTLQVRQVKRMLEDNKTDSQIMESLQIPHRTYYRYKGKIIDQDKEEWAEVVKESLESRALKIKQTLEWSYVLNKKIAEDQTARAKDRIEASRVMVENQVNIWHLLKRGPRLGLET